MRSRAFFYFRDPAALADMPEEIRSSTFAETGTELIGNLADLNGIATGVSLDLAALSISSSQPVGAGDTEFLRADSFIASNNNAWSLTFNNLSPGIWKLYYYASTNALVSTGDFTVNGVSVPSIHGTLSDNLAQGTDWDVLMNVTVTNGTLALLSTGPFGIRGLAGAQLVQTSSGSRSS